MPVSFEAMGYSSICSEQEYTGYIATEKLVESFKSLVKQEYTGYTATETLVALCLCNLKQWSIPSSVLIRSTQGTQQLIN